ncbi:hypothetical protein DDE82_001820 [Stemphylium lycopersici]|nr:hypothetical protein DDE82_001820 [Stemphylium lycopersici]
MVSSVPISTPAYSMDFRDALRSEQCRVDARKLEDKAKRALKGWLDRHRRLQLLSHCPRYKFFTDMKLQLNEAWLKDLRCKGLREIVEDIVRLQRQMACLERKMEAAVEEEKKLDREFWELVNKYKGKKE